MRKRNLQNDSIKSLFYFYLSSAIVGMIIRSIHGFIDGIFVGNGVGEQGLAAVNMALPLIIVVTSSALLFGVGGATNVSIQFGKGNEEKGRNIFISSIIVMLIVVGSIQLIYFLNYEKVIYALGSNEALFGLLKSYGNTIMGFAPAFALNVALTAFVRNDSNPRLVMFAQTIGAVTNVGLNAIFIFVLKMGLLGAALGTGIAHIASVLTLCTHFANKHGHLRLNIRNFKFAKSDMKPVLSVGFPNFIAEIAFGVVWLTLNLVIMNIKGDMGVSAFGITFHTCNMGYAVLYGVSQAMQPISSFNFGSKSYDRVKKVFRLGILNALIIGAVFSIFSFVMARQLVLLFGADTKELIDVTISAIRIMSLTYIFVAYNVIISTFFQSIGDGKTSLLIQILRGFVLNMIFILTLPRLFGFTGVLFAFPLGEVISSFICMIFMKRRQKIVDIII